MDRFLKQKNYLYAHAWFSGITMVALIIGEASASSSASARLPVIFASEICPYPVFYEKKLFKKYARILFHATLTTSQKVLFMAVIPEVRNRESIFFKKLCAPGFPPFLLGEPAGAGAGMTIFYEFTNVWTKKGFKNRWATNLTRSFTP